MSTQTVKSYYNLTKPGIIYGNVLATVATFLLAANGHINILLFLGTILGTALIIGSSCVFNNYIDRDIDKKMKRTAKRALAIGSIPVRNALILGLILGVLGFATLILFTNWLVVATGIIGMFCYLTFYTTEKRRSPLGTLVGAVPGAMPPVAGFVAVTGKVDMGAVILFFMWVFWQLPHFWAIGVYRLKDYAQANLPILPVKKGIAETKKYMLFAMIAFLIFSLGLTYFHYTGIVWLVAMIILGVRWIMLGIQGFKTDDDVKWGKKVFGFSLVIMLSMCLLMALNVVLP